MVGDGKTPNLFFVTRQGVVVTVTRRFPIAYAEWCTLPRTEESAVEDRQNGTLCSVAPDHDYSSRLIEIDDSAMVRA